MTLLHAISRFCGAATKARCITCDIAPNSGYDGLCPTCREQLGFEIVYALRKTNGPERQQWLLHARSIIKEYRE